MFKKKKVTPKIEPKVAAKKFPEPVKVQKIVAVPEAVIGPKCVECGKPVAEGQAEVCKEHIRRG